MTRPRFTISVLCHNRVDRTRECLHALVANSNDYELVVTDNASSDETPGFLAEVVAERPWIRVVRNEHNLGFQEPNRRAFAEARGEFFVMLNNDCVVCPNWLEVMRAPFLDDPRIAVCGLSGGCCQLDENLHGFHGSRIEYVEGACMMVRTELVRELPHQLFAPYITFAYGEDSDLCFRVRRAGLEIAHVALPIHHHGQATSAIVPGVREFQEANHVVLRHKWRHYLRHRRWDTPILARRSGANGDVLLMEPALRQLRAERPNQRIYVQTDCPEVLRGNPNIDGCAQAFPPMPDGELFELNMAYENRPEKPVQQAYAEVLELENPAPALSSVPRFHFRESDLEWAERLGIDSEDVAVHAEASWPGKTWPAERFEAVLGVLRAAGRRIVLVGKGRTFIGRGHGDLDLRDRATLSQTAAALSLCRSFVGIDSLPMHLALSGGTPAVGLFGVSSPEIVAGAALSKGLLVAARADRALVPCVGERHRVAGQTFVPCDGSCMRAISLDWVLALLSGLS